MGCIKKGRGGGRKGWKKFPPFVLDRVLLRGYFFFLS